MQEKDELKTTQEEVETIRKEEVVDVYGDLLQKIWNKVVITLGIVTLKAIMRRSLIMTAQKYDFLEQLDITDIGDFIRLGGKAFLRDDDPPVDLPLRPGGMQLTGYFVELLGGQGVSFPVETPERRFPDRSAGYLEPDYGRGGIRTVIS